jgi:hypothetical protein
MEQRRELSEPVVQLINHWVKEVDSNPTIVLGEWLYAFSAMSAMALKSQDLTSEQLTDAVKYMNECLAKVYQNVPGSFTQVQ